MRAIAVHFDIRSYWHAGTGRGAGPELDAVVFRSAAGLPMLPGRTVRGLLRDGLEQAERFGVLPAPSWAAKGPVHWCFGPKEPLRGTDEPREDFRFVTEPGCLRVESAVLGETPQRTEAWERWASAPDNRAKVEHLFRPLASTKVDEHGIAEDKTLRAIEVAVPMKLTSLVTGPEGQEWPALLRTGARFIRGLGSHRHRGLGRVAVSVSEVLS